MKIEAEDDNGKIQQVSGGFGDSNSMDPEVMRIIKENQERADKELQKLQPLSSNDWQAMAESEEYEMLSNCFEFAQVLQSNNFGIKFYKDSVYKGELLNGKR